MNINIYKIAIVSWHKNSLINTVDLVNNISLKKFIIESCIIKIRLFLKKYYVYS